MSNLQQHQDRLDYIAKDYWRQYEHPVDHAWRVEAAEAEAGSFFAIATKGQKAVYDATMSDLRGLYAPKYDRAREAAKAVWEASTTGARALYEISFEEILRDGELSEATAALWEALPDFVDLRECA